ncbi:hypothetical protein C2E23DRAFT_882501 [Lenzites betulinus]|nr:hypothetical protein C2E23DRAFT_882501 [Lenzites betulinus]
MPSFRTALALFLVPAMICGAIPTGDTSALALSPVDVKWDVFANNNNNNTRRGGVSTRDASPSLLAACSDPQCTTATCHVVNLSEPQLDVCMALTGGPFHSFFIVTVEPNESVPYRVRLGQENCNALSFATLSKTNVCNQAGGTIYTNFRLEAGETPGGI